MAAGSASRESLTEAEVFVHPNGLCDSREVGAGTRVWAFAHVMAGARIGRHCNIGGGAFVEQGAVIGDRVTVKNQVMIFDGVTVEDDVFLGPGTIFTNDLRPRARIRRDWPELRPTLVRSGATLGAGVVVVCGITVGRNAFAAAGAVLSRDADDHALLAGNPARRIGWVCGCGERLDPALRCPACGTRHERAGTGLAVAAEPRVS